MVQLNFTTTNEGYPVVNTTLVTPFSDQYVTLDLGYVKLVLPTIMIRLQ